ncbi:MOSC domain-containing protein [Gemmobacter fulvus]|uniref:MOSC domain-containing protein n=1 Tax=Gemmobacter fulvus TaxID=2840474 RepID=A0A975S0I7_9RHOB|nr:MOSC domain-containing protein [Gemmobacter fulvus]MBT9245521.1 MOSC domain-containing protein [Gemmobacter fulvus]MDQ1847265.1 MOSC domain-containing protein [Gemmobacter fulvus]QWK89617.1 MOSC domain-containing protein [Gemmobacter fulvus]
MTVRLAHICRHPIKSHGREDLASVRLLAGEGLPWDRHWAVAHEAAKLVEGWNPCVNFARGSKAPALMAISAELNEATAEVTLRHPDRADLTFRPDAPEDLPGFLDWVRGLNPEGRAMPERIVSAGRIMSDTDYASVSILNLASGRALSQSMGTELSPYRWRGNLWVEGWEPWAEWDLVGRQLRIGSALLEVRERIERCNATKADPETGQINADTLGGLRAAYGHQDFGVYAVVIEGGEIALGQPIEVIA